MKLVLMEIGQKFLMQKENRIIKENEISIHEFENGYILSNNSKSTFYKKSLFSNKNIPNEIEFIDLNKIKISFISFNNLSNLIPSVFFNKNSLQSHFQNKKLIDYKFKTYFDKIKSNEIVNIYMLKENDLIMNFLSIKKISIISHYKTILLNILIDSNKEFLKKNIIYVNLQIDSFDIFYFIDNKFNISNSFRINNTEEFLYYFFYFTEQFNLNSKSMSIVFLGKFKTFEKYYKGIRDFQNDITFLSNSTDNKDYIDNHPSPFLSNFYS